jgi:hypothetical protein
MKVFYELSIQLSQTRALLIGTLIIFKASPSELGMCCAAFMHKGREQGLKPILPKSARWG